MYDIVIVGAGPAGLCAAIYARRANKSVLILDKAAFGGQITFSPKVENYPAFDSISGSELADHMVSQVLSQGADVEIENVIEVRDGDIKTVVTEDGNEYEFLLDYFEKDNVTSVKNGRYNIRIQIDGTKFTLGESGRKKYDLSEFFISNSLQ